MRTKREFSTELNPPKLPAKDNYIKQYVYFRYFFSYQGAMISNQISFEGSTES